MIDLSAHTDFGVCPVCRTKLDFMGCPSNADHTVAESYLPIFEQTVAVLHPHPVQIKHRRRPHAGRWFLGWRKLYRWQCETCDAKADGWQADRALTVDQAAMHRPVFKRA